MLVPPQFGGLKPQFPGVNARQVSAAMKILMLGWEFPPHISGGLGTACLGLTRGLAHHGAKVLFVLPRASGDERVDRVRFASADVEATRGYGVRELEIDSALSPYLSADGYAERLMDLGGGAKGRSKGRRGTPGGAYGRDLMAEVARYARAAKAIAGREAFDVVHAHDWMTFPAGIEAARAAGKPLVVHVHACEHDRSAASPNPAIEAIEQRGLSAADRVVCVSRHEARVVSKHYRFDASKVRVVHNAVTPYRRRPLRPARSRGRDPVVLFLGRVTSQKGPGAFLEAAARVLTVLPRTTFVVAGSGDLLPSVVEQAARLRIARRVRFTGFLGGADVARAYASADVYVMPSVSEPFGISPLEAMSLGVPVIVSRNSGVAEVVRHAIQVDPDDVEDLAGKILSVLLRPGFAASIAAAGRAEVARLSWDDSAKKLLDVYEETAR